MSTLKLHMSGKKFRVLQPSLHVLQQNVASEEAKICLFKSSLIFEDFKW